MWRINTEHRQHERTKLKSLLQCCHKLSICFSWKISGKPWIQGKLLESVKTQDTFNGKLMFFEISPEEAKCLICVHILNVVYLQQTKSTTFFLFVFFVGHFCFWKSRTKREVSYILKVKASVSLRDSEFLINITVINIYFKQI